MRVGEDVDENDLKMGWFPDGLVRSLSPGVVAGPRSYSSQLYVNASPSESEAVAVSSSGVEMGTTKSFEPTLTIGTLLPVAVLAAHRPPAPLTVNEIISLMLWL